MGYELINLGKNQKWLVFVIQFILNAMGYLLQYNLIPINYSLQQAYGIDPMAVSFLNWIGAIGALCAYVPISSMMLRLGLKWSLITCCLIATFGLYLETFLGEHLSFLFLGYFFCMFGVMAPMQAYVQTTSLWFQPDERTAVLLVLYIGSIFGYWVSHRVLKIFVNNHNDLSDQQINTGVVGYLYTCIVITLLCSALVLIGFPSYPIGEQIVSDNEGEKEMEQKDKSYNPNSFDQKEKGNFELGTYNSIENSQYFDTQRVDQQPPKKIETIKDILFWPQFFKLIKDPIFLVLSILTTLGTNTIGSQNISLTIMLNLFDIPEGLTLYLADASTLGTIFGALGYFFISKLTKTPLDDYLLALLALQTGVFVYWVGFMYGFWYCIAFKFIYNMANSVIVPLSALLLIRYFKRVDPSLILLATSTLNIIRTVTKTLAGSYVGYTMRHQTQARSLAAMVTIQACCCIACLSSVAVWWLLRNRRVDLNVDYVPGCRVGNSK